MADDIKHDLTGLTVELLSVFVANTKVRSDDLPALIASTHAALSGLGSTTSPVLPTTNKVYPPAVTPRKSLASRDVIVSLIDGKPYKSLKRHLTGHGLTPETYRERYKLPATYPMVAPDYSDARRETAKRIGLGRTPRAWKSEAPAIPARKPPATRNPPEASGPAGLAIPE